MPSEDIKPWELAQQHAALYQGREGKSRDEQNVLAPKEHRAFAKEAVAENPALALPIAAAIPLYQGAKALGLTSSRSDPSVEQATEAYKGIGEGLKEAASLPPWEIAKRAAGAITQAVDAGVQAVNKILPWEIARAAVANREPIKVMPKRSVESVFPALLQAESKGVHEVSKGKLTTSGAGAEGITQLMPETAKNPGFGIEGVKDKSEGEYLRVGKEYLSALYKKYGDFPKALAAYNSGMGNVDKAIRKGGEEWMSHLPQPKETIPYINKILGTTYGEKK
jgi:soluble lytic murein transglycosylase-like protein